MKAFSHHKLSNRGCSIKLDLGFIVRKRGDSTFLTAVQVDDIGKLVRTAASASVSRACGELSELNRDTPCTACHNQLIYAKLSQSEKPNQPNKTEISRQLLGVFIIRKEIGNLF